MEDQENAAAEATENEATAGAAEGAESNASDVPAEAEAVVEAGVDDVKDVYDFAKSKVEEINKLPKKSNYHNARRSAYKSIMELIIPTPPKPKKSKGKKAAEGEGSGDAAGATEGSGDPTDQSGVGDTGAA